MRWRVCLALIAMAGGVAWAQCPTGSGRTTLEVEGIGFATFEDFETDRATGSVLVYGNVCVEDVSGRWELRATRVEITGLRRSPADPSLTAEDAVLTFLDWRLEAAAAVAVQDSVTVTNVDIFGPDVVGTADSVRYEIPTGRATMRVIELQGSVFRAWAASGALEGETLILRDAVATTCACAGDPVYTVAAPQAEIGIAAGSVVLQGGVFRTLGVSVPLPERVDLTGDLAEVVRLPIVVAEQTLADGDLGQGLTVLAPRWVDRDGVLATFGVTSLFADAQPIGSLRARGTDAEVVFAIPADGFVLDTDVRRDLGSGFRLGVGFHNRATPRSHQLHQGILSVRHSLAVPVPSSVGSLDLSTGVFAAVSAQRVAGAVVAGPRLGADVRATYASPPTPVGRFRAAAGVGGTTYPEQGTHQFVVSLAPSWALDAGPVELSVSHEARWVDGGSPFASSLDRVAPKSVSEATAILDTRAGSVDLQATFGVEYDWLPTAELGPGFIEFGISTRATLPGPYGVWSLSGAFDGAGFLSDRAEDDPFVQAAGAYAWSGHEVGARVRYDLRSGSLTDAVLSGRVRIDGEKVSLTPFLAVDVAPLLSAGSPELAGHGLELEWRSCCGTLVLGYEQLSGELRTSLAFRVGPDPLVSMEIR